MAASRSSPLRNAAKRRKGGTSSQIGADGYGVASRRGRSRPPRHPNSLDGVEVAPEPPYRDQSEQQDLENDGHRTRPYSDDEAPTRPLPAAAEPHQTEPPASESSGDADRTQPHPPPTAGTDTDPGTGTPTGLKRPEKPSSATGTGTGTGASAGRRAVVAAGGDPATGEDRFHSNADPYDLARTQGSSRQRPAPNPPISGKKGFWPREPSFQPVAHFEDPHAVKPQCYQKAVAQIPPSIPQDPLAPYLNPGVPRKRKSDWPVLMVALVVAALLAAAFCAIGLTIYTRSYGS